jgi:hypothetical protein
MVRLNNLKFRDTCNQIHLEMMSEKRKLGAFGEERCNFVSFNVARINSNTRNAVKNGTIYTQTLWK